MNNSRSILSDPIKICDLHSSEDIEAIVWLELVIEKDRPELVMNRRLEYALPQVSIVLQLTRRNDKLFNDSMLL